jgi:type IV pilus assembly protein PilO
MAILPQEPRQQKALGAIILVLGALYAFHTYWYTPRVTEIERTETRVEQLTGRNRNAQISAARGGADLEERIALYQRHMIELERLIPQSEEVPQLMRTVSAEARSARVSLSGLQPEPSQPGEHYTRQIWSVNAFGEYDDIGRFLTSIASLPRIATPVNLDLAPYAQPQGVGLTYENPVLARFRIELYVLPERQAPQVETGSR